MAKIHIHTDASGRVWNIERQTLPKKRGEYVYFTGESAEVNHNLRQYREDTLKKVIAAIVADYGTYIKPPKEVKVKNKPMENELYKFMIKNAQRQIASQDPHNPKEGDFSIFGISEVLAMLTCKQKEDVIADIIWADKINFGA
jgi:hypothetical protein